MVRSDQSAKHHKSPTGLNNTDIAPIPRDERCLPHKTSDKNHARRLTAILMMHRGERVSDVAQTLYCARSSMENASPFAGGKHRLAKV